MSIDQKYLYTDKLLLLNLCKTVIYNDPTRNCIIKGNTSDWSELPNNLNSTPFLYTTKYSFNT